MLHHRLQHDHVVARDTEARCDSPDQFDANLVVVTGVALADVVEESSKNQKIGATHPIGKIARIGRRLPQMPIDREAVIGVSLRTTAIGCPLRK